MSYDIQIDGINSQRTVIISDQFPCILYYKQVSAAVHAGGQTTLTVTNNEADSSMVRANVIVLTGAYRSYQFTIKSNTNSTNAIVVYGDASGINGAYITIVHTAASLYAYCVENTKDCIAFTCDNFPFDDGSPEAPKSYPDHLKMKIGTGKYNQSVSLSECELWDVNPRNRLRMHNLIGTLFYQWHKINSRDAVFLVITVEEIDEMHTTYSENYNWNYKYTPVTTVQERYYLAGFPMSRSGKYKFNAVFSVRFEEAWANVNSSINLQAPYARTA